MAKQDEKQRIRRKLQEKAIELAAMNRWDEAVEANRQILQLGEDPDTYNRLGKAFMELGQFTESHDAYQHTLRLTPTNSIARKNLARLDALIARGFESGQVNRKARQQVDLRMFITETGRTAIAQIDPRVVRLLIRETYQDPSQRNRISFPGKLGEGATYVSSLRYEEYEDMVDDDDTADEAEAADEEYIGGEEEEELGLEEIDQDIGDEDENIEE